jgi:hypothetical protein
MKKTPLLILILTACGSTEKKSLPDGKIEATKCSSDYDCSEIGYACYSESYTTEGICAPKPAPILNKKTLLELTECPPLLPSLANCPTGMVCYEVGILFSEEGGLCLPAESAGIGKKRIVEICKSNVDCDMQQKYGWICNMNVLDSPIYGMCEKPASK